MKYSISRKDLRNRQLRNTTREGDARVDSPSVIKLIETLVVEVQNKIKKEGKSS